MLNYGAILLEIWEHTTYTLNYPEIFWEYMAYMEYTFSEQRWVNKVINEWGIKGATKGVISGMNKWLMDELIIGDIMRARDWLSDNWMTYLVID